MQNKDLGLDKENVVSVYTSLWYNVAGFKQELLRNPNVKVYLWEHLSRALEKVKPMETVAYSVGQI